MLKLRSLSGPFDGLADKIAFIKGCYRKSLLEPQVRRAAEEWAGKGTRLVQTKNLYDNLKKVTAYLPDPVGVEMTKSPAVMLRELSENPSRTIKGDCDDMSCLSYTMLNIIGIPTKLRVAWYRGSPLPRHIYPVAFPGGLAVPFDLTTKRGLGYEHPYAKAQDF